MTAGQPTNRRLDDLLTVLSRLAGLYEQHGSLLDEKLAHMRSADQESLRRIAREEEDVIKRLHAQDGLRRHLTVCIGKSLGLDERTAREATISQFSARLAEPYRSRLPVEAKRLRTLVEQVRRQNARIERVARQVLANLREVFESDATAHQDSGAYGSTGTLRPGNPCGLFETVG